MFTGGPGSGAREICDQLIKSYTGVEHLSVSELLGMQSEMNDPECKSAQVKAAMETGDLVSDVRIVIVITSSYLYSTSSRKVI